MNKSKIAPLIFIFSLFNLYGFIYNLHGRTDAEKSKINSTEFRIQLSYTLTLYFELEKTIFDGDTKISAEKAMILSKTVSNIDSGLLKKDMVSDWRNLSQELQNAAENLTAEDDISIQRSAFLDISNALIDMVKNYGPLNMDVFLYHCPMALNSGGHWLSASKDFSNPYLGEEMASCGTLIESFEAQN
jgi:hypothetical protein